MAIFIPLVTKFDPKGLNNAQRALAGFQNFAVDVGRVAAAALTGIAVAGVREAAQFETSFAKIQGLVGVSEAEIAKLEEAARKLGPSFGVSANEAADALFFITSAGLRGEAAINVLEASLAGAAIGLGETKTIADLATSAVNAYGESNLDGAKAVDVLAEAVRLGKLEPAALAESMGQVLPLASNLGVSFAEVGAAMAGMSKTGTDASTAATQLRQILATLAKPTNEANTALAEMGLSAEGLRQQITEEGLFATLETLTTAFDGNIEATTEVFGNIRALSGVLDLMGASVDDNRELFAQMTDETGILSEALAIAQDTAENKFNVAMESLKGILMGIGTEILERLLPHLENFNTFIAENGPVIEETFTKIYDAIINVGEAIGELLAEDVLPQVKKLMESEDFRNAVDQLALGFTVIATEARRFVQSDLGKFLIDITGKTIISGVDALGKGLERVGIALGVINDTVNLLRGKKGEVTAKQLNELRKGLNFFTPFAPLQGLMDIFSGGRATGGLVGGKSAYLVGERGPELFIPQSSGMVVPNRDISGAGVTKKVQYNITVNAGMGSNGAQLGEQIVNAIKRYERTSGPVFVSA